MIRPLVKGGRWIRQFEKAPRANFTGIASKGFYIPTFALFKNTLSQPALDPRIVWDRGWRPAHAQDRRVIFRKAGGAQGIKRLAIHLGLLNPNRGSIERQGIFGVEPRGSRLGFRLGFWRGKLPDLEAD